MKEWEKPQLVVLTRSRPEEAVLGWCKQVGLPGGGPGAGFVAVACFMESTYVCGDCSAYATS